MALLPSHIGVPLVRKIDNYLDLINTKDEKNRGVVDKLIKYNEKTQGKRYGSSRYYNYNIDLSIITDLSKGAFHSITFDRPDTGPIKLHLTFLYQDGTNWKIILPLQFLLKGWGDANDGYQCYVHVIKENIDRDMEINLNTPPRNLSNNEFYYAGITGRNWLKRFDEHLSDMRRGSRKWFHTKLRDSFGINNVLYVSSLIDINHEKDDAMKWEEVAVDKWASDEYGLNMIPGGYKGLRFLHEHRITNRVDISLEDRDKAIAEYIRRNPRKGIPNPLIAELWEDDEYYQRINEAHPKRLSADQVRQIRKLAKDEISIKQIAMTVKAIDERQVKDVIEGITYKRIK
jgi:hypothetical protein